MTNYFTKLFHIVIVSTQLGCVAANFDHPFDGVKGLLSNALITSSKVSIIVKYNGKVYKNGDTLEILATKSNIDNPAELTIVNNSGTNLNLTAGTQKTIISGTNASNFTSTNPSLFTLIPGNSTSFTVKFNTNTLGDKVAEVSIPNDDLTNSNFKLNLKGVFEPSGGTWVIGNGKMNITRTGLSGVLLSNSTVLLCGGIINSNTGAVTNLCEIYDPASDSFSTLGNTMNAGKYSDLYGKFSILNMNDGGALLIGSSPNQSSKSLEKYNQTSNSFVTINSPQSPNLDQSVYLKLNSGNIIFIGGTYVTGGNNNNYSNSTQIFNTNTMNYSTSANMVTGRWAPAIALLPNGNVLIVGGYGAGPQYLSTAEIYDPTANTMVTTGGMATGRFNALAIPLTNGKILVVGGQNISAIPEIYNPSTGTFSLMGSTALSGVEQWSSYLVLENNKLLVVGVGYNASNTCFFIDAGTSTVLDIPFNFSRKQPALVRVDSKRAFLFGGGRNDYEIFYY